MGREKAVKAKKGFKLTKNWIMLIVLVLAIALFVGGCATVKAVTKNPGVGVLDTYISAAKSQNVKKMASVLYPKGSDEYKSFVSDYNKGKKDYKSFVKKSSKTEIADFEDNSEDLVNVSEDRGLRLDIEQTLAKNISDYTYTILSQDKDQIIFEVEFTTDMTYRATNLPVKYSNHLNSGGSVSSKHILRIKRDAKTKKWMFASDFRIVSGQRNVQTWVADYDNNGGLEVKHVLNSDIPSSTGEYRLSQLGNVVSVGRHAFDGATSLKKLIVPNNLVNISDYAFYGCKELVEIVYEDGTHIGVDSDVTVGDGVFWGCEKFGSGSVQKFDIPKINKNVPNYLFYGAKSMSGSITIPADASIIGHYAFYNCSALSSVNIHEGITTVGDSAFEGCESLTTFRTASEGISVNTLSDNVTRIGSNVFKNCLNISTAVLPSGFTEIDSGLFDGCVLLKSIVLPENLKSIGARAFKNTGITEISIPATVEKMGDEVFAGSAVKSIKWNDEDGKTKIRTIGKKAFNGCEALVALSLPQSVKGIGAEAFIGCASLRSVMVDFDYNIAVGDNVFEMTDGIPKIYVKDNVSNFRLKWYTMNLDLYSQNIITADREFAIMDDVRTDANGKTITEKVLVQYLGSKADVTLDTNITRIGDGAFAHSENLETITNFGDLNLTDIGLQVFAGCKTDKLFTSYGTSLTGQLKYLGSWLIDGSDVADGEFDLTSNKYDVKDKSGNITAALPDTVGIAGGAFVQSKDGITKATISKNVKYISERAFAQIAKLVSVEFAEGSLLERIGDEAFYSCQNLDSVTLPKSFKELGARAFQYCDNLRFVVFNSDSNVSFGSEAFTINYSTPKIYVNNYTNNSVYTDIGKTIAGSYDTRSEDAEKEWNERIVEILKSFIDKSAIDSSGNYAVKDGVLLQVLNTGSDTFETPSGITSIGAGAFAKSKLVYVTVRAGVQRIEEYAFYNCSNMMEITFKANGDTDTLAYIGSHAFRGLTQLSEEDDAFIEFEAKNPNASLAMGDEPFDSETINRKIIVKVRAEYEKNTFWKANSHMIDANDDPRIKISIDTDEATGGLHDNTTSMSVDKEFKDAPGNEISITAIADEDNGYSFLGWKKNGEFIVGAGEKYDIEFGESGAALVEYTAVFTRNRAWVTIEIEGTDSDGYPAGKVYRNSTLTDEVKESERFLTATNETFSMYAKAIDGYHLVGWYVIKDDGTETEIQPISNDPADNNNTMFTMEYKDFTIIARFERDN